MCKRYNNHLKKVNTAVDADPEIEVDGTMYRLTAAMLHKGVNRANGHYVALTRYGSAWWECDDTSVKEVMNIEDRLTGNREVYVMFYLRE